MRPQFYTEDILTKDPPDLLMHLTLATLWNKHSEGREVKSPSPSPHFTHTQRKQGRKLCQGESLAALASLASGAYPWVQSSPSQGRRPAEDASSASLLQAPVLLHPNSHFLPVLPPTWPTPRASTQSGAGHQHKQALLWDLAPCAGRCAGLRVEGGKVCLRGTLPCVPPGARHTGPSQWSP